MSKVYVYTRNSNAEAFEKGSSRETQIKKCNNYAQIKDLEIDEIIEEDTIDALLNVNLKGVIICAIVFAPILKDSKDAIMINITKTILT